MSTQLELAMAGQITPQMASVAADEQVTPEYICAEIAAGRIVIPNNPNRPAQKAVGIGNGLRTKVNASIGTSSDLCDIDVECAKARAAEEEGADTLMELSAGGDLDAIRRAILDTTDLPVGNVPLYQAFCEASRKYQDPNKMDPEYLFDLIEQQLADGLSFMAIHCGINLYTIERLKKQGYRYGGLVSKGGTFMVSWMMVNGKENPLYEQFDRVAGILARYDAVLSLGNGVRAGSIDDSHDRAQMAELVTNCELADEGRKLGCQMMVEGPGHVPIDEIEANIIVQKRMSGDAPYYMLGPLPTDIGAGYDHITQAIGAAISSRAGADLVCYITPAEHLALPNEQDVREGVRAARLACHIGDIGKLGGRARERDKQMALARRDMDWAAQYDLALFPQVARDIYNSRVPAKEDTCTMCGEFCANRNGNRLFSEYMTGDRIRG